MARVQAIDTIRSEIIANHVLMHVTTLVVLCLVFLLAGYVERRQSALSVIMPLLTVSWAAAMVRFDYMIHRLGAYISFAEQATATEGWETWRARLRTTVYVMPVLDALAALAIVGPTIFVLFGPASRYFSERGWRFAALYRWSVLGAIGLLAGKSSGSAVDRRALTGH